MGGDQDTAGLDQGASVGNDGSTVVDAPSSGTDETLSGTTLEDVQAAGPDAEGSEQDDADAVFDPFAPAKAEPAKPQDKFDRMFSALGLTDQQPEQDEQPEAGAQPTKPATAPQTKPDASEVVPELEAVFATVTEEFGEDVANRVFKPLVARIEKLVAERLDAVAPRVDALWKHTAEGLKQQIFGEVKAWHGQNADFFKGSQGKTRWEEVTKVYDTMWPNAVQRGMKPSDVLDLAKEYVTRKNGGGSASAAKRQPTRSIPPRSSGGGSVGSYDRNKVIREVEREHFKARQ